jgi:WD domain, G-beta repeat
MEGCEGYEDSEGYEDRERQGGGWVAAEQRVAEQAVATRRLRQRLMIAVGLGALALLAAVGAFWGFRQAAEQQAVAQGQHIVAEDQRVTVVAAAGTAEAQSTRADEARIEAEEQRRRANEQAGTAEAQRVVAVAAQATAEAEEARAEEQSRISLTRSLAAQAVTETERGEHERGALLARLAQLFDEVNGGQVRDRVDAALRTALSVPPFSHSLRGHEGAVTTVAFASNGRLASGSWDGTVRLWNLANLEAAPAVLKGHEGRVFSLAFSPDGQLLTSAGQDGTVRLWLARTETLVDQVCSRVWRNLTLDEWRQFVGAPEQVPYQATCPDPQPGEDVAMATSASGIRPAVGGHSYTSPTYGYSLEWDKPWLATWEESAAGQDVLVLYNSVSAVRFEAGPGSNGDAAQRLQEATDQLRRDSRVTNVILDPGREGEPLQGGDRSRAFVVFSFTHTAVDGMVEERVRHLECRTLAPGNATLVDPTEYALRKVQEATHGARRTPHGSRAARAEFVTRRFHPCRASGDASACRCGHFA